jgi:L-amino acid N-acyltransferase YncA
MLPFRPNTQQKKYEQHMIRNATPADIESIAAIYNEAILEGGLTGDLEPVSIESRRAWYSDHQAPYAIFVTVLDGSVVGYAAISPYREGRGAFKETCEISYYMFRECRGRGLGKALINHAIEYARQSEFRIVLAFILECNRRSIDVLMGLDFSIRGRLPNAANINEERVDHIYLARSLY